MLCCHEEHSEFIYEVLCKIEKHYRNMPLHVCPLAQSPGASCKPGVLRPNVQREITPQVEDKV